MAEGVSRLKEQRENNRLGMGAGVARRGGAGGVTAAYGHSETLSALGYHGYRQHKSWL